MFNNPYLNNFGGFPQGYPQFPQEKPQQPIQNIFTNQMPQNGNDYFMAKMLKPNQNAETEFVNQKTAFIDLNNKKLSIKEVDGTITSYEIILPLDEKDRKIMELQNQINELQKGVISNEQFSNATTNNESTEPIINAKKFGRK